MTVIQWLLIAFSAFAILKTVRQFRLGNVHAAWLGLWVLFWVVVGAVAALPETTDLLARLVGVGRGADLAVYVSIVALFYGAFRLYAKLEDTEREITRLVRVNALQELGGKEKVDAELEGEN